MWKKIRPYLISVAIALGVGGLSAFFTRDNMGVYDIINRPALAPPAIVFPIVWGILFTLMGISSAAVYNERDEKEVGGALIVYALNLVVNFFWSIIFFNMQAYFFAVVWLILLWIIILWMILRFYRVKKWTGILQIPYLIWVSFALYLTIMISVLN